MRRVFALVLLCLLLTGCGKEENVTNEAVKFRADLVQAGGCSYQVKISADFGDSVEEFTLSCRSMADGTTDFTILAPETLEGITARVTDAGGKITYEGMGVDFGLLANDTLAPAAAPALLVACWSSEYIASAGFEGESYRASYEKGFDEKTLKVDTWFENNLPIYAEVCYNNSRILRLELSEFQLD